MYLATERHAEGRGPYRPFARKEPKCSDSADSRGTIMTTETEFARKYMEYSDGFDHTSYDYTLEVHYNHYGSRGCVDLVEEESVKLDGKTEERIGIVELKSEHALESVTGANEILRQFNKHKEYFFDGTTEFPRRRYDERTFYLLFYATPATVKHVTENVELYRNAERHGSRLHHAVALWHEETGTVHFTTPQIWENDTSAAKLREITGVEGS